MNICSFSDGGLEKKRLCKMDILMFQNKSPKEEWSTPEGFTFQTATVTAKGVLAA